MVKQSVLTVFLASLLSACGVQQAPPCPYRGEPTFGPSAGCLHVVNDSVLVVENLRGVISLPGGSSDMGEPTQCTAFRETWEETGLRLQPRKQLTTFATGFQVYRCERDADSGEIDPPLRLEIKQAFYLPLVEFDNWQWRFPGQEKLLHELISALHPADPARPASSPAGPRTD